MELAETDVGVQMPRRASTGGNGGHRGSQGTVKEQRLASALGWFSIGLGLAEIVAPHRVARMIGVDDDGSSVAVLRMCGVREVMSGVGILTAPDRARWVKSRVAGDAIDLALLGAAMRSANSEKGRVAMATAAVLGVTALDVLASSKLTSDSSPPLVTDAPSTDSSMAATITINRPVEEVYAFWRALENLSRFMSHVQNVEPLDEQRARWTSTESAGESMQWVTEIIEELPNKQIVWRSLPSSDVYSAGWVRFATAPGGRGTVVRVELQHAPPGGKIGAKLAKLIGRAPGQRMKKDLRHLKQLLETGEIVHSDASIAKGPHPARPSELGR